MMRLLLASLVLCSMLGAQATHTYGGGVRGLLAADVSGDGRVDLCTESGVILTASYQFASRQFVPGLSGRGLSLPSDFLVFNGIRGLSVSQSSNLVEVQSNVRSGSASSNVLTTIDLATRSALNTYGPSVLAPGVGQFDAIIGTQGDPFRPGMLIGYVYSTSLSELASIPPGVANRIVDIQIGDLDGDGDDDIAALAHGSPDAVLLFEQASNTATFAASIALSTSNTASSLALGLLDNDSQLDIAVALPQIFVAQHTDLLVLTNGGGALSAAPFAPAFPDIRISDGFVNEIQIAKSATGGVDVAARESTRVQRFRELDAVAGSFAASDVIFTGTNITAMLATEIDLGVVEPVPIEAFNDSGAVTVSLAGIATLREYGTACGDYTLSAGPLATPGQRNFNVQASRQSGASFGIPSSANVLMFGDMETATPLLPSTAPCELYVGGAFGAIWTTTPSFTFDIPSTVPLQTDIYFQWALLGTGPFANGFAHFTEAEHVTIGL